MEERVGVLWATYHIGPAGQRALCPRSEIRPMPHPSPIPDGCRGPRAVCPCGRQAEWLWSGPQSKSGVWERYESEDPAYWPPEWSVAPWPFGEGA